MSKKMMAVVVENFQKEPVLKNIDIPTPLNDEVLLDVLAASVNNVTRSRANDSHYSANPAVLPLIPGLDGVGRDQYGKNYYFLISNEKYGAIAQQVPVSKKRLLPLPQNIDPAEIAASMNPALSSWMAISQQLSAGVKNKTVLVLGATGYAGRLAVEIARYLGARKVIAAGRNQEILQSLPADDYIQLNDNLVAQLKTVGAIDVVLDYLWGIPAQTMLKELLSLRSNPAALFEWVQIGSIAGKSIELPADALRSNNLRLLGSGIGSIPVAVFGKELFLLAQLVADGKFNVHPLKCQLTDFNQDNWQNTKQRIVYIPNQFKPAHQGILSKLQENIKFTIMKAVVNLKLSY